MRLSGSLVAFLGLILPLLASADEAQFSKLSLYTCELIVVTDSGPQSTYSEGDIPGTDAQSTVLKFRQDAIRRNNPNQLFKGLFKRLDASKVDAICKQQSAPQN
jgi:hypothetical protein